MCKPKTFFMVYNPLRADARVKHATTAAAQAEAKRLSVLQPGDEFFILQAVAMVSAPKPPAPVPVISPTYY